MTRRSYCWAEVDMQFVNLLLDGNPVAAVADAGQYLRLPNPTDHTSPELGERIRRGDAFLIFTRQV